MVGLDRQFRAAALPIIAGGLRVAAATTPTCTSVPAALRVDDGDGAGKRLAKHSEVVLYHNLFKVQLARLRPGFLGAASDHDERTDDVIGR